MSYSEVLTFDGVAFDGAFDLGRSRIARNSSGEMVCVVKDNTERYLITKFSDDDGATWSSQVTAHDYGATGHDFPDQGYRVLTHPVTEEFYLFLDDVDVANDPFYAYKYDPVDDEWDLVNTVNAPSTVAFSPYDWAFTATGDIVAVCGDDHQLFACVSDDNGASFSSWSSIHTPSIVASLGGDRDQCTVAVGDDLGNVHVLCSIGRTTEASNGYAVYYYKYDGSTWSTPELAYSHGAGTADQDHPKALRLVVDENGVPHAVHQCWDVSTNIFQIFYYNRKGGSWNSFVHPYGSSSSDNYNWTSNAFFCQGDTLLIVAEDNDNDDYYLFQSDDLGDTWETPVDITAEFSSSSLIMVVAVYQEGYGPGKPTTGLALTYYDTANDDAYFFYDDAVAWGVLQIPPKTVTHSINFDAPVEVPSKEDIEVSASLTKTALGGRSSTRIGSRLWCVALDSPGGKTKALYSDDNGDSWTVEDITISFAAAAHSLNQAADGQPMAALWQDTSTQLQIFKRSSGGSWSLQSTVTLGSSTIHHSFELMWDGTAYNLLYAHHSTTLGARQVSHRTSSTLATWTSATTVNSGDTAGIGANLSRGAAFHMDSAGDIHAVYSLPVSDKLLLRYRKYTSFVWGTAETIEDFGSDITETNRATALTIVTDANDIPHISYQRGATAHVYYRSRVGGSWTAEERVDDFTTSAVPSISMNLGTTPVLAFSAGSALYLGVRSSGWGLVDLGDYGGGSHFADNLYQARYNTARTNQGCVIFVNGSVTMVSSLILLWDDETNPISNTFTMSQAVALQGFAYPVSDFEISQVVGLNFGYQQSHTSSFSVSQVVANPLRDLGRGDTRAPVIGQLIGLTFDPGTGDDEHARELQDRIYLSHSVGLILDKILVVEHDIVFTDSIKRTIPQSVSDDIEFTDVEVGTGDRLKSVTETATLSQVVFLNKILNLDITHNITFGQSGLVIRDWDALSDHFDPGWSAVLESDVGQVVFLGPADLPTQSLTLKKPEFGDLREDFRRTGAVHRNRSGQARTFMAPVYSRFSLTWSGLLRKRAEEFRVRILQFLGDKVRYIDHNGVEQRVVIVDERFTRSQSGPDYVNVQITLEKDGRVDLDPLGAQ